MTVSKVDDIMGRFDQPIQSAWSNAPDETGARVGFDGVTRIEPYRENGQMARMVWLRVWKGDKLVARLNAAHMAEIKYE